MLNPFVFSLPDIVQSMLYRSLLVMALSLQVACSGGSSNNETPLVDNTEPPEDVVDAPADTPVGVPEPIDTFPAQVDTSLRQIYLYQGGEQARLGEAVAGLGDVDGDGIGDYVLAAPELEVGAGYISVHSGADGRRLYRVVGDQSGDAFGISVAASFDIDGDAIEDIIVGAIYGGPVGNGYVRILSGADGSAVHTFTDLASSVSEYGWRVAGPGDLDGDGFGEIVIGTIKDSVDGVTEAGRVRVFSGQTKILLYSFQGSGPFRHLGQSVSGVGDVDQDGYPDFAMGSPIGDSATEQFVGRVAVVSGQEGTLIHEFFGPSADSAQNASRFGRSVAGAGDVNGDNVPDIVVGAITYSSTGANPAQSTGKVYVFSGLDGSELFSRDGDIAGGSFGESVSGAGDLNGDGVDDIVATGLYGGLAISGADQSILFRTTQLVPSNGTGGAELTNPPEVKSFGMVRVIDDINQDGASELLLGAPLDSTGAMFSGKVLLISGKVLAEQRFEDDFEDDIFADGSAGEPANFLATCGISDADVFNGQMTISGPLNNCDDSTAIITASGYPGEKTVTLQVSFSNGGLVFGEGITLAIIGADGSDIALLALLRTAAQDVFSDAVIITLGDESAVQAEGRGQQPVLTGVSVITQDASDYSFPDIFEMRIILNASGEELLASGSYRSWNKDLTPADIQQIPFIELSVPTGGGAPTVFSAREIHRFGFIGAHTTAGDPFSFAIDSLGLEFTPPVLD